MKKKCTCAPRASNGSPVAVAIRAAWDIGDKISAKPLTENPKRVPSFSPGLPRECGATLGNIPPHPAALSEAARVSGVAPAKTEQREFDLRPSSARFVERTPPAFASLRLCVRSRPTLTSFSIPLCYSKLPFVTLCYPILTPLFFSAGIRNPHSSRFSRSRPGRA